MCIVGVAAAAVAMYRRLCGAMSALADLRLRVIRWCTASVTMALEVIVELLDAGLITLLFLAALVLIPLWIAYNYLRQVLSDVHHAEAGGGDGDGLISGLMERVLQTAQANPEAYFLTQFLIALIIGVWFLYLDEMNAWMVRWKAERSNHELERGEQGRQQGGGSDGREGCGGGRPSSQEGLQRAWCCSW